MDIALILLAASALVGAAAGLQMKALALVPIAAVFSAAVLHVNGFEPGSGIVIIIGCLVLNQAAYVLVQIFGLSSRYHLSVDDDADRVPASRREQAIDDNHGNQRPSPFRPYSNPRA